MEQQQGMVKFNQRFMAETIKGMKGYFQEELDTLITSVKVNTDRFDENDNQLFNAFLQELQRENMAKLMEFWRERAGSKNVTFETYNSQFQINFSELLNNMATYKNDLTRFFTNEKQKELNLEDQIESLVIQQLKQKRIKRSLKVWKDWFARRQAKQQKLDFCDSHYAKNLVGKTLLSWRSISYKPAYEKKVYSTSECDIQNIQMHYMDIIQQLKNKISETEDLIEIKKQAKAEFAYSLSKNLMKAISNLSMEVMSLNQMTLKDQRIDTSDTQKFISRINQVISEKQLEINEMRENYRNELEEQGGYAGGRKVGSLISFQEPMLDPLSKISLDRQDY